VKDPPHSRAFAHVSLWVPVMSITRGVIFLKNLINGTPSHTCLPCHVSSMSYGKKKEEIHTGLEFTLIGVLCLCHSYACRGNICFIDV
jgi:hypothetical protein